MLPSSVTIALALASLVALPPSAEAVICAGAPGAIASATRAAAAIFVATATHVASSCQSTTHADGSIGVTCASGPRKVDLTINESFKGSQPFRLQVMSDYSFAANERYLVFANIGSTGLEISPCSRTRLLSEAAQDLKFLRGANAGLAQAIVYGQIHRQRDSGERYGPTDLFTVVALADGVRNESESRKYGHFDLVVAPGRQLIWVEQDGRQLTNPEWFEIKQDEERPTFPIVLDSLAPPQQVAPEWVTTPMRSQK